MAAEEKRERRQEAALPPTPPDSEQSGEEKSDCSPSTESSVDYPLPPSTTIPTEILDADKKTPDEWLARDPRLIRLTGVSRTPTSTSADIKGRKRHSADLVYRLTRYILSTWKHH